VATSAVYRVFDSAQPTLQQTIPSMPSNTQLLGLKQHFPDHLLLSFPKTGGSTARDFKWLGSYRYGILHLGGQSEAELTSRLATASELLGWPAPVAETYATATFHVQPTLTESTTLPNRRLTA
jgi:hypothetical protein